MKELILATLLFSNTVTAGTVIEIASFKCPHCLKLDAYHDEISQVVTSAGHEFVFAPIPSSKDSMAEELIYYYVRDAHGKEKASQVRKAFFTAHASGISLTNKESIYAYVEQHISGIDWAEVRSSIENNRGGSGPLIRAVKLLSKTGISTFPSFVLVDGEKAVVLQEGGNSEAVPGQIRSKLAVSKP
jgi:hypothetical protein